MHGTDRTDEIRRARVSNRHRGERRPHGGPAANPSLLTERGLVRADLDAQVENLAPTYLIRLFAEFETGLREYWATRKTRKKNIPGRDMIDSLSSARTVDDRIRQGVHAVRKYRNSLVHEDDSQADSIGIPEARRSLCIFFGRLPEDW